MRVVFLPLVAGHLFLRAEREQFLSVHARGQEREAHRARSASASLPDAAWCATLATPCDCVAEGCGWSSRQSACVLGGITDCLECPNPMMCGDETCMLDVLADPEVVAAQKKGEACLEDGNDMAVCLCDATIGDVLAAKLHSRGCCDANEMFSQMCYERRCMDVPVPDENGLRVKESDFCHKITEPCECGIQPGCGWDTGTALCEPGGVTNCDHCAHSMLCSKTDSRCSAALFKNPDFLETINRAKVCMEAQRDPIDVCIANEGDALKKFIDDVQINGAEKNCCEENKYFKMVCEKPPTPPLSKAGEGPCGDHKHCEDGLFCEDGPDGAAKNDEGLCFKPGDGQGPCKADGDCRTNTTCGEDELCHVPLKKEDEPCEEDGNCEEGLTCGDDKKCQKALGKDGEPCEEDGNCEEGLTCGDDKKCLKPLKKEGEPCEEDGNCEEGLTCGDDKQCHGDKKADGEGPCAADGDCNEGLTCGEDELCHAPLKKEGEPCEEDGNCEEGLTCGDDTVCEAAGTTTSTTSVFDIMRAIERIAKQSGLVTTTPAPEPEPEAAAPVEAGDAISDINKAAKANHDATAASVDATNERAKEEIGSRKIPP